MTDIAVVPEQRDPDGDPDLPVSRPQNPPRPCRRASTCQEVEPDLLLATEPDADRVGFACADGNDYTLLTGDDGRFLLLDYICRVRTERGDLSTRLPSPPSVSSAMVDALAEEYGFELRRCLAGSQVYRRYHHRSV